MEGLKKTVQESTSDSDPAAAWAKYLEKLQREDPEEYELVIKDMQQMVEAKKAEENIVTRPGLAGEDDEFAPRLPGTGSKVMGKEGVKTEDTESVKVQPEPGFVIKTKTSTGEKIFINICKSPLIQKPSMRKQLAEDGTEQEGLYYPMSAGPGRPDRDNAGAACTVYDLIFNPEVLKMVEEDKTGGDRDQLAQLALARVSQKYDIEVDYKYKFPKLVYKGDRNNPAVQYIRKRQAPVIEEVEQTTATTSKKTASTTRRRKAEALAYSLEIVEENTSRPCEGLLSDPINDPGSAHPNAKGLLFQTILDVKLGEKELLRKLKVELSPEFFSIRVDGLYLPVDVYLPFPVDEDSAMASFNQESGLLRVEMQRSLAGNSFLESKDPDPGSRAWLLANALSVPEGKGKAIGPIQGPENSENQPEDKNQKGDDDDDTLPEDRFHLTDMMSQHIKEERERERLEKIKRHEEEEEKKKAEEARIQELERQKTIKKLLEQAEKEVKVSKVENFLDEDDDDDMLV